MESDVTLSSVSMTDALNNLNRFIRNPSSIVQTQFDLLDEIMGGQVKIVDAVSPFVALLTLSASNTALAVNENLLNLRSQYPSLAVTREDLYRHMSDRDYVNQFSSPAEGLFTIGVQLSEVQNKMVLDQATGNYKATIARDTTIEVEGTTYTLQYPIDITLYPNKSVTVSQDPTIDSPFMVLSTNLLEPTIVADATGSRWLLFQARFLQYKTDTSNFTLSSAQYFKERIEITDKFFAVRAYYRNEVTNTSWVEMRTTHTEQVFDNNKPTVLIKVFDTYIEVSIPAVYQNSNLISSEVRFDVFTTKGKITVNMGDVNPDNFVLMNKATDEARDLNIFTQALASMSVRAYSKDVISGGSDGLTLEQLRDRVVNNALGSFVIPITNVQIDSELQNMGFDIIREIDATTNRVFLATRKLPDPTNTKLLTPANIGMADFITAPSDIKDMRNVIDNGNRLTIRSGTLFRLDNGIMSIVDDQELDQLNAMNQMQFTARVNELDYATIPFYYVLDSSEEEFDMRPYNLDQPMAANLSYESANVTLQMMVFSSSYVFEKVRSGYKLTITTKSGTFYKEIPDNAIFCQIGYYPVNEHTMAYVNGTLIGRTEEGERIFEFMFESSHNIDSSNNIEITNAKMFADQVVKNWTPLKNVFHIFHLTNDLTGAYVPYADDSLPGKFLLPSGTGLGSYETLQITFGTYLKNLWTATRSLATGQEYERYDADVVQFYTEDVYQVFANGSTIEVTPEGINRYKLHSAGDVMRDAEGNVIYKFRKGDVKLDADNNPIVISDLKSSKELSIFFVDARQYFANDPVYKKYTVELVKLIEAWVLSDLGEIQKVLLDQTRIFFHPKVSLGHVTINVENDRQTYVESQQSFDVDLWVTPGIHGDAVIKKTMSDEVVRILNEMLEQTEISITDTTRRVKEAFGDMVKAVEIKGFGGDLNYRYATVSTNTDRLCLKKKLVTQADGTYIVQEAVTVNFLKVN